MKKNEQPNNYKQILEELEEAIFTASTYLSDEKEFQEDGNKSFVFT